MNKYKVINSTDEEVQFLYEDEIVYTEEVTNKEGKTELIITWHDDEFCVNSTLICDRLEIQ